MSKEKEKLLEKIKTGEISFLEVVMEYVKYLQDTSESQRQLVVELSILTECYKNKGLWQGTKEDLENKYLQAKELAKVFEQPTKNSEGK